MGHVGGNDEDSGGDPYKIPETDYGEEGEENYIWYMDNTVGHRGVEDIWNAESVPIHLPQAGESGTVLCMGERVLGRGTVEGTMVEISVAVGGSQVHSGKGLVVSEYQEETEVQPPRSNKERQSKGVREMVDVQVDG